MEQEYSVGTTNRYAMFLDEEDDPGDVVVPSSAKPEKDASGKGTKEKGGSKQQGKGTKGKENKERIAKEQQSKKAAIENAAKAADKNTSGGRGPKQGGRGGDRERGERQDNRRPPAGDVKEREDRPPRGQNAGGRRQRLPSKEKDRDVEGGGFSGGGFGGGGFGGDREGRGSRGRGGPRPFRGGRGGFRGGKREYERRSGSDRSSVKATEKREGGGAHNWGKADDVDVNEEWATEEAEPSQEQKEPTTNGETAPEEPKGDTEEGEKEQEATTEEEEGPREMTLEEYKQKHSAATVKSELSVRKAGENVDDTQWKDTVELQKDEEEFFPGTREVIEKVKTSGRIKTTLESHFFFKEPARRGRGRSGGGRGGFEGGRGGFDRGDDGGGRRFQDGGRGSGGRGQGGGGGRRFNRRDRAPNVEDERDFPSLGGQSAVEVM